MMKLGKLQLNSHIMMAPMAGITDYPFRQLVREMECGLVFTEMVSAEGFLRKGGAFLKIGENEHPISVQLFGSNPWILAEAASKAEAMGADAIDLNMGCPAKKVVKTGAGVCLMRFPEKVKDILVEMRKSVACLLTVKIRSGWDEEQINAIEIAKLAEDCGVDAITVHPRTKDQGFRGQADWGVIAQVKRAVRLPVIGNGDVRTRPMIQKMLKETGCDGVMIGRGAMGNPWIFSKNPSGILDQEWTVSLEERRRMVGYHFLLVENHYGERSAVHHMRKHLYWYTKGLPYCTTFHSTLTGLRGRETMLEAIHSYFDLIQRREPCQSSAPEEGRSVTG